MEMARVYFPKFWTDSANRISVYENRNKIMFDVNMDETLMTRAKNNNVSGRR